MSGLTKDLCHRGEHEDLCHKMLRDARYWGRLSCIFKFYKCNSDNRVWISCRLGGGEDIPCRCVAVCKTVGCNLEAGTSSALPLAHVKRKRAIKYHYWEYPQFEDCQFENGINTTHTDKYTHTLCLCVYKCCKCVCHVGWSSGKL